MRSFFSGFLTTFVFVSVLVLTLAGTFIVVSFVASSGGSISGT